MDASNLPGHNQHLAPGMSQSIYAGKRYTIKDDEDQELELVGVDRPWTVEFLTAFDNYMTATAKLGSDNEHTLRFAQEMRAKWLTIPSDLMKLLPSGRGLGLRL